MFEFLPYASILKIMYRYSCRWIELNLVLFSRFFQASRVVIFISTYSSVRSGTAGSSTGSICLYRNTVILGFAPVCTLPKKLQWSRSAPALRDVFWSKLWHAWCAGRGIPWYSLGRTAPEYRKDRKVKVSGPTVRKRSPICLASLLCNK